MTLFDLCSINPGVSVGREQSCLGSGIYTFYTLSAQTDVDPAEGRVPGSEPRDTALESQAGSAFAVLSCGTVLDWEPQPRGQTITASRDSPYFMKPVEFSKN